MDQPSLTPYIVSTGSRDPGTLSGLGLAAAILLVLALAYALYRGRPKKTRGRANTFVGAGVARGEWPGPTMTFPLGEVWPYPSYY